jgi:hypothetical protein
VRWISAIFSRDFLDLASATGCPPQLFDRGTMIQSRIRIRVVA